MPSNDQATNDHADPADPYALTDPTGSTDPDDKRFTIAGLAKQIQKYEYRSPGQLANALSEAALVEACLARSVTKETWLERALVMWDRCMAVGDSKGAIETAKLLARHLDIRVDQEQAANQHVHLHDLGSEALKSASTDELESTLSQISRQLRDLDESPPVETLTPTGETTEPSPSPELDPENDPLFQ